jgi:hypothetical protein
MLVFAREGMVCLIMAAPIILGLAVIGALGAHFLMRYRRRRLNIAAALLAALSPPGVLTFEHWLKLPPPIFAVSTSLDIAASPEVVWNAALAPSKLPSPRDLPFRMGIGYPQGFHIVGEGATATRYCDFSTGKLVEPVLEWRRPQVLRFAVTKNPQPMREWTPFAEIHPPHLEGFLESRQGQFRLIPIDRGTRLEATTWYQHGLWPAEYWRWWSDAIIHRIHRVVLEHIKEEALKPAN